MLQILRHYTVYFSLSDPEKSSQVKKKNKKTCNTQLVLVFTQMLQHKGCA